MQANATTLIGILSRGILKIPFLSVFLNARPQRLGWFFSGKLNAVAGWGFRATAQSVIRYARAKRLPYLALEDGFLRSFGTGDLFPPLAMVVDSQGIYYDATSRSDLECLLNSAEDVLAGIESEVLRAKSLILTYQLSKYNHAPAVPRGYFEAQAFGKKKVLVVDQTMGDMSIALGGAGAADFSAMLTAARMEHPDAVIYVKTHPEVTGGRKGGYLTQVQADSQTVVLRNRVSPLGLLAQMDHVYVVTSTMGFEALLAGKPVTCFGLPWYAGWGATDDRQGLPRRTRTRSVDELFAAAYFHYSRYLNPFTHQSGRIFDVIEWLCLQQQKQNQFVQPQLDSKPKRICVGFSRWKAAQLKPMLSLLPEELIFVATAREASRLQPGPADVVFFWGTQPPLGLAELVAETRVKMVRVEDGFVRSVGLGSDLIRPLSLVFDSTGIYFDPRTPSDLEILLNQTLFSDDEIKRAESIRALIVQHGVTKYNLEPREQARWSSGTKRIVLVPGQVEDDASIQFGCSQVRTNLGLLQAARLACPDAFIVYKPHPDVMSGNRRGKVSSSLAYSLADYVETRLSVVSCIDACDEVHTMTSLTGFDALLRGKRVVTYGQPFYAGWGLTDDRVDKPFALARRQRKLSIDELVVGVLIKYPIYWDWELKGYTCCETVLNKIILDRSRLACSGELEKLRTGFLRRQWRRFCGVWYGWTTKING